jgi:hypothetical protein
MVDAGSLKHELLNRLQSIKAANVLKPTHALTLKYTFTSTFIKTLKLVKNVL